MDYQKFFEEMKKNQYQGLITENIDSYENHQNQSDEIFSKYKEQQQEQAARNKGILDTAKKHEEVITEWKTLEI